MLRTVFPRTSMQSREFETGSDISTEMGDIVEDEMEVGSMEEFFEVEEIFSNSEWHDGQRDLATMDKLINKTSSKNFSSPPPPHNHSRRMPNHIYLPQVSANT
ncbi:formin-like protein 12 isoform X2 [Zingiber officinale]|uniref:formin-like protein 12 isoform X2 n=1 Tax=Zingiber officinale TaxID=94328 RepID=UPI001C4BA396|nr:formin-like protein 12 isoform X2 [Zingiber officinale]